MEIGVSLFLNEFSARPEHVFRKCEALGFDAIVVAEHPIIPVVHKTPYPSRKTGGKIPEWYAHIPDPMVLLGLAAAVTKRIRLMTGVSLVPEHNPIVLAKEVSTLDHYSKGRFILGAGSGWLADESEIMGVEFRKRWSVTRECIRAMKELWTKPEASFAGKYVNFPAVQSYPKPFQRPHPPILIGANGDANSCKRALKDVVALGDGWAPLRLSADRLARELATLKQLCTEAGRDFDKISITIFRPYEGGSPRETIEAYRQAGAHCLVVGGENIYESGKSLEPDTWEAELEELANRYVVA